MEPPAAICCARNIAFLHLLHEVPIPPSKNSVGQLPIRHEDYTLPFDRERQLAGAFAFLSCIRHDNSKIPAVCLQEIPEAQSLNLLVTVNKKEPQAGLEYLRTMKVGFENIFKELNRVGSGMGQRLEFSPTRILEKTKIVP